MTKHEITAWLDSQFSDTDEIIFYSLSWNSVMPDIEDHDDTKDLPRQMQEILAKDIWQDRYKEIGKVFEWFMTTEEIVTETIMEICHSELESRQDFEKIESEQN